MLILISTLVFSNLTPKSRGADSYSEISFLKFQPKSIFWIILGQKGWIAYFACKLAHRVSQGGDL